MYDVCILGGGPGGYNAATRAAEAGLKTVLIEDGYFGGVCLNEGCIPSKTLLNTAKILEHAKDGKSYAFSCENAQIEQDKLIRRKNKVVKKLIAGVKSGVKNSGAEIIDARGEIVSAEDGVIKLKAGDENVECKNLIIATGSSAVIIPFEGLDEVMEKGLALTNKEVLDLKEIPESMVVIGGGVIGLEMACYYAIAGTKVSVVEMLDHIAGETEKEIASILQKNLAKLGIEFNLSAKVTAVKMNGEQAETFFEKDGENKSIVADKVLLSIGRRPNSADIGLENIGVEMNRAAIKVNDKMQTNVEGVYAIGDVIAGPMLAHAAYREGEVAVNTIVGKEDKIDYRALSSVIYTVPEVASCGKTADQCEAEGINYEEIKLPMGFSGRYQAETERGDGICKLILSDRKVIGCHVIGNYASEFITLAAAFIHFGADIDDIKKLIFPHPTVCEIIREAVFKSEE